MPPHDQHPPQPHTGAPPSRGADLRDGLVAALVVAVSGVLLGLLWFWLAPRVPLISDGSVVYLKDPEGEQSVAADGWFTLMALGFGALSAVAVYFWRRGGGVALAVALAVGGLLAALVAWRIGVWLGPTHDVAGHAKAVGAGKVFSGPLQLRATGSLLAWPVAAMAVYLLLTSLLTPRPAEPAPRWDGWSAPGETPPGQGTPPAAS
nr:DUF2567 domain-containing protein [Streptomyces sp. SID5468]